MLIKKFIIIFFLFIFIFIFYFNYNENKYFEISLNENNFFIVPINKGGHKISNLNKKSLHIDELDINNLYLENQSKKSIEFSIQLFTSDNYNDILIQYEQFLSNGLKTDEIYIFEFNSSLGLEYFILYKNFKDKDSALKYCLNYLKILDNCIIINALNIN